MKRYLVTCAILIGLCLVFSLPGLTFAATMATLGLAVMLLAILLNVTILMVAVLPAVLAWPHRPALRVIGIAVTAAAIFAAFVLPGLLARQQVAADAAAEVVPIPGSLQRAEGIEILRPSGFASIRLAEDKHGDGRCDAFCRSLLAGRGTPWVRVTEYSRIDDSRTSATFRLSDPQSCAAFGAELPLTIPCIVYAPDPGQPAELHLAITEDDTDERAADLGLARRLHRVTATLTRGDAVLLRRDATMHQAATGLWMFPVGSPFYSAYGRGIAPVYRMILSPDPDIAADIADLGLPLAPSGSHVRLSHWSARVASALDLPDPRAPVVVADMQAWVGELSRARQLPPAYATLVCRIAALGVLPDTTIGPIVAEHGLTCP